MNPLRIASVLLVLIGGLSLYAFGDDEKPGEVAPATQAAEAERTGFPVELENDLGMRFRLVPVGNYRMGSPEGERGRSADESAHEVHMIRPYYLQTTEVTNAQFRAFLADHTSGASASGETLDGDDQPVVNVSWQDATAYAAWLGRRDPRFVYRLPTEAEWEWACRAGTRTPFSCGETITAKTATLVCEVGKPPPGRSAAVGTLDANPWGFFDQHGNAAEWCHDWYGPHPLWRQDNPQGASSGEHRIVRGGSWADPAERARCAARAHLPPEHRCGTVGFRLAFGLGYGRTTYGRHTLRVETYDPTVPEGEKQDRPGWPIYMISVVDRLTDRVNGLADPRWTLLREKTPLELKLAPGIYYVYCFRMEGDKRIRSIQRKFAVPGTEVVRCPIPRGDQENPQ